MTKITLGTFNIGAAAKRAGEFTRENLDMVVLAARDSGAEILCLQEVDFCCGRSDKVDMPAVIAEGAGYPFRHFIKIRDFQGGEYGTLILGRYPILEKDTFNYPVKLAKWGTSAGMALFCVGDYCIRVFNSHLSCEDDERNTETMQCYAEYIKSRTQPGDIVAAAADFNEGPEKISRVIDFLTPVNLTCNTFPGKNIDNILLSPGLVVENVRTIDTISGGVSDHIMLLADIILQ